MSSTKVFRSNVKIKFREADPAGLMYFANLFSLAHDVFEDFLTEIGVPFAEWFAADKYLIPIRHAEGDYLAGFMPGENYEVKVCVSSLSTSTFCMRYEFSQIGKLHATVNMAHTFIDAKSKSKISVPDGFRNKLNAYLITEKT